MRHFGVEKFKALLIASTLAVAVDFMMTLFDSVIGGHLLGEQALAGIGLVNAEIMLITFFAMLLGAGTAINFITWQGFPFQNPLSSIGARCGWDNRSRRRPSVWKRSRRKETFPFST